MPELQLVKSEQEDVSEGAGCILVGVSVVTAGQSPHLNQDLDLVADQNGASEEAECCSIGWTAVNALTGQVLSLHQTLVKPDDTAKINGDALKEGLNVTLEDLSNAPTYAEVLHQLNSLIADLVSCCEGGQRILLVTDGPCPIRQLLIPECHKKGLVAPLWLNQYLDVRKVFRKLLNNNATLMSVDDILGALSLSVHNEPDNKPLVSHIHNLQTCISQFIEQSTTKGTSFWMEEIETVKIALEQGVCLKSESITDDTVVRARGLPWQSSDQDVAKFFVGLNIAPGGVALCLSSQGRRNGEALVRFSTAEHRELALRRHRHFMGNRYLEIYRATGDDFINVAAGNNSEAQEFLQKGAAVIVRMRGLPYDATATQIIDFFAGKVVSDSTNTQDENQEQTPNEDACEVMQGEQGILFVNRADGRATGDAFVLFESEVHAAKALAKHKQVIGTRYIELFRSTTAEVQQVINKTLEPVKPPVDLALHQQQQAQHMNMNMQQQNVMAQLAQQLPGFMQPQSMNMNMPQQLVITGTQRKDCVRLRGLPYESQVHHILDFLGDFSRHIVFQGVHMVYNHQGHPSGEAFIQMDGEQAALATAMDRHNKYMSIGKKQRYIEVFQCSAEDMNLVVTGPTAMAQANQMMPPQMNAVNNPLQRLPLSPVSNMMGVLNGAGNGGMAVSPVHNGQAMLSPQQMLTNGLHNGQIRMPGIPVSTMQGLMPQNGSTPISTPTSGAVYPYMWPYPSPPMSPTNAAYYAALSQQQQQVVAAHHQQNQAQLLAAQQQQQQQMLLLQQQILQQQMVNGTNPMVTMSQQLPTTVWMRGVSYNASTTDLLAFFQGYPEVSAECIQINRNVNGQPTGDVFVSFGSRDEAVRAINEKSHSALLQRPVEMYLYAATA